MKQLMLLAIFIPLFTIGQNHLPKKYNVNPIKYCDLSFRADSTFILTSSSFSSNSSVLKTDLNGNLLESLHLPFENVLMTKRNDSTFNLVTFDDNSNFYVLVELNHDLDTNWTKKFEYNGTIEPTSISFSNDSSILISGKIQDSIQKPIIINCNQFGNEKWVHAVDFQTNYIFDHCNAKSINDTLILFTSTNLLYHKSHVCMLDTNGNILWSNKYSNLSVLDFISDSLNQTHILSSDSSYFFSLITINLNGNILRDSTYNLNNIAKGKIKFISDTTFAFTVSEEDEYGTGSLHLMDFEFNHLESFEQEGPNYNFINVGERIYTLYGERPPPAKNMGNWLVFEQTNDTSQSCSYPLNIYRLGNYTHSVDTITPNIFNPILFASNPGINLMSPNILIDFGCNPYGVGAIFENQQTNLSIYPNPSQGTFTIETEGGKIIESLEIHASDGRLVYTEENLKKSVAQIQLKSIPKGIYFVKAKIGTESVFNKIVITD